MQIVPQIKIALVGFGLSSKIFHLPFILHSNKFQLVAVISSKPEEVHAQLPQVAVFGNLEEMLKKMDIDLVVISSPNHTHYELAKICLQYNKHMIVEKPFVTNSAAAEELINIAQEKKLILCAYQNRRWDGPILLWRKLMNENIFGDIYQCNLQFNRYRPIAKKTKWKELALEGSGLWFDLGPHLIDHAINFFGIPDTVQADIAIQRADAVVDDYFDVTLTYGNTKVILHSSSVALTELAHIQVYGDKASYICYNVDEQESKLSNPKLSDTMASNKALLTINNEGVIKSIDLDVPTGNYQIFYNKIYDAIIHGAEPPISNTDMLNNIRLLELAMESSKTGQKLSLDFLR